MGRHFIIIIKDPNKVCSPGPIIVRLGAFHAKKRVSRKYKTQWLVFQFINPLRPDLCFLAGK